MSLVQCVCVIVILRIS